MELTVSTRKAKREEEETHKDKIENGISYDLGETFLMQNETTKARWVITTISGRNTEIVGSHEEHLPEIDGGNQQNHPDDSFGDSIR
eukprot:gnl/Chilomastix_caulleri/4050.p2 GENE.gnl/Chilomastix_caulleri/4050~~gnl/Chilomastix_caulleri/4050.p2  ORF type:complete len:87 (+),score=16.14 gnl/Chilomastix_caulleri/4050:61-321(+)